MQIRVASWPTWKSARVLGLKRGSLLTLLAS